MKNMKLKPQRGDIYLANFNPAFGREIRKIRPGVIVQNNIGNQNTPYVIICPLSTKLPPQETNTLISVTPPEAGVKKPSVILCNFIYTFDKQRLIKKIGTLLPSTMNKVDFGLTTILDI